MKNTAIFYMYRDGSNYKNQDCVVVAGEFTAEQRKRLERTLCDEQNFIAHQVGFQEKFFFLDKENYFYWEDMDHPFHEYTGMEPTESPVTDRRTPEQLVRAFEAASRIGWEEFDIKVRFAGKYVVGSEEAVEARAQQMEMDA